MNDIRISALHVLAVGAIALTVLAVLSPGGAAGILRAADAADGATVSTSKVDRELVRAYRRAKRDAAAEGVEMHLTSGWRSRAHQERLFAEAVQRYGSEREANRWVATPDTSAHVRGEALDVGPTEGALWLGERGADYGLCRTYANEVWHFELLTSPGGTCPEMLPDGSAAR